MRRKRRSRRRGGCRRMRRRRRGRRIRIIGVSKLELLLDPVRVSMIIVLRWPT
jgi:hypothetical protein